jgi:RNA polymerase sigma-70 factor (ECF subfamily)
MLFAAVTSPTLHAATAAGEPTAAVNGPLSFDAIYDEHFDFAWRSLRRLGVPTAQLDDAAQDVFLVVLRRLADFRAASTVRTWLFGIVLRVARDYRRKLARKPADPLEHEVPSPEGMSPESLTRTLEAARVLHGILDTLSDERREVFVLAELEQMSAPEIAEALDANINTVYSRIRAARRDFESALARYRARRFP